MIVDDVAKAEGAVVQYAYYCNKIACVLSFLTKI
jgi:hypothetical protein